MGLNLNSVYSKKKTVFDIVNTDAARYDKYDDHMLESSYLDNYILECNNMIMESVNDAIVLNESVIGDFIQDVGKIICKIIKAVVNFIAGIINAIVNAVKGVIRFIKDAFTKKKAEEKEIDLQTPEAVVRFEDKLAEKLATENIYMDICDITNTSNLLNNNCPPLVMSTYSDSLNYSEMMGEALTEIYTMYGMTVDNPYAHNKSFGITGSDAIVEISKTLEIVKQSFVGYAVKSATELFGESYIKRLKSNDTLSSFADKVVNPELFGSCNSVKTKLTIDLYRKAKDNMNNTEAQVNTVLNSLDKIANVMYKDSGKRLTNTMQNIEVIMRRVDPKDSTFSNDVQSHVRCMISDILTCFKNITTCLNDILNSHVKMALYKIRRINLVYGVKGSSLAVITKCEKDLVDKSSYTEHVSIDGFSSDAICSENFMESMNDSYTKLIKLAEAEYVDKKFSAIFESYLLEDDNNNNNQNNNNNGNNNQNNNNNGNNNNNNGGNNNQNNNNNGDNNQNNQNGDNNQNNNSGNNDSNKKSDDEGILKKIINAIKEFFQKILDLFKKKTDTKDPESAVNQAVHGTPAEKSNGEDRTKLWNAFKNKLANYDASILEINNFTLYKTKDIEAAFEKIKPYLDSIGTMQNAVVNPSSISGVLEDAIKNNKSSADIANDLLKKDLGIDDDGNKDQSIKGKLTRFFTLRKIGAKKEKVTQELYNEMYRVVDECITSNITQYVDNFKQLMDAIDKTVEQLDKASTTNSGVIQKIEQIAPKETITGTNGTQNANESYLYEGLDIKSDVDTSNTEQTNKAKSDAKYYRILLEGIKNCVVAYCNISNELFSLVIKVYNDYYGIFKTIMKTFNEYNAVVKGKNNNDNNDDNQNNDQNNNNNQNNGNNNGGKKSGGKEAKANNNNQNNGNNANNDQNNNNQNNNNGNKK